MKQNDITDLTSLSLYRYENFFNVYQDNVNNEWFYNILKSVNVFPANNATVEDTYTIKPQDTWYGISYNYYNTAELWWLVCTYNQIMDASRMPETGSSIKLLKSSYVGYILQELNKQLNR